jgi:hypothetical protein
MLSREVLHITVLSVVLYRYETWTLILRAEHWLKIVENMALRRIFGLSRVEVVGSCGELHDEELHNVYSSPSTIRRLKSIEMRLDGHAV